VVAPTRNNEEWGMALWSRKSDEDYERYRKRTADRLRGLASTDLDGRDAEPDQIRARIERLKAQLEPDARHSRGTA